MKKIISITAMILVLAVMFCFAGCGEKSAEDKIVGKWTAELDFSSYMNSIHSESDLDANVIPDTAINAYMVFEFDGEKCSMYYDKEKTVESINGYLEEFKTLLTDYLYKQYEATGLSREEIDTQFKALYDVAIEEFAEMVIWSTMDAEQIAASITEEGAAEGYYQIKEDKIYIADTKDALGTADYYSYSFDDGKLLISGASNEAFFSSFEEAGIEFPMVFEKN